MATILVVEDNEDARIICRSALEHAGHRVLEAGDGEQGVRVARECRPDVILMDISIPVLDGWEATRMLKAEPDTSGIPIIALTAHVMAADRARAEEVGCDGYLPKPAHPNDVVAAVERVLAEAERQRNVKGEGAG